MTRAVEAFEQGKREDAFLLLSTAIQSEPENARAYYVRGRLYSLDGQAEKAVADFDRALRLQPGVALIHQQRGVEQFKLGRFRESVADFDKYLESAPQEAPNHWQRGIACYYAGQFEEGRKQFELHQTVNRNDVENAVWHFLCVARKEGVEKARGSLIRIDGDSRVPMKEIHALFAGKGMAEEVIAAARKGGPTPENSRQRLFYAHLYVGLFYEAEGNVKAAREHLQKAARDFKVDHYMWEVARVHAALLRDKGD